jgi:hypothetical protein
MAVRAKMTCVMNKVDAQYPDQQQVRLEAVYSNGDDANASWSKDTPSGRLELSITNPEAFNQFVVGKTYHVDFTSAD